MNKNDNTAAINEQERQSHNGWVMPSRKNLRSRIMYIENKGGGLEGDARIGRVYFSKSGKSLYYKDKRFQSLKGMGFKSNYIPAKSTGSVVQEKTKTTDSTAGTKVSSSMRMSEMSIW